MDALIWAGAALSLLGLVGLIACIISVWRAKRRGLAEADLRAHLQRIVAWNLGSLLTSALGLGMVAIGVILS
ncbi:MAG: hypothetical protein AAF646_13730 [Pseudomonadota bacterium]